MSDETALMKELRIAASQMGARLLRQNTGVGWVGKSKRLPNGDVLVKNARPLHAGFVGWSDLGGWVPVTITPEPDEKPVSAASEPIEIEVGGDCRVRVRSSFDVRALKRVLDVLRKR